jgi:hypothetical protein
MGANTLIMHSMIRTSLCFLIALVTTLSAETETEFVARVTDAWKSADPTKVLALYGDSLKADSDLHKSKAAQIAADMQTRNFIDARIIPFGPVNEGTRIMPGQIVFMPRASCYLAIKMGAKDPNISGTTKSFVPVVKSSDDKYSVMVPKVTPFEWNGPPMDGFDITLQATGSASLPPVIVVYEACGHVSFIEMKGPVLALGAHKIKQLMIPPVEGGGTVNIVIRKRDQEPFFKKSVDGSKGALIPIESPH